MTHAPAQSTGDARLDEARNLLMKMAEDHAVSWSSVSRSTNLSVHKLRAYYRGLGAPLAADITVLRALGTQLDDLAAAGVADPASWPYTAVVPGYTLTPHQLESTGIDVMDLAWAPDKEAFLDVVLAGWRVDFWSDYEVVRFATGESAIQLKDSGLRAAHLALASEAGQ